MSDALTRSAAEDLLFREAALLDSGAWDEWLALYTADALFWMPAWKDETTPTEDPEREISLIYYNGRGGLEDRVRRATSGLSAASAPRPRVVHMIGNVRVGDGGADGRDVDSNFTVHYHDVRLNRTHSFFGHYRHRLVRCDGEWRIAAKTIWLLNDCIPTVVDFYTI